MQLLSTILSLNVDFFFVSIENRAASRSRKIAKVMHEFMEKLGINFANVLNMGVPHSQPKRKLINISGEGDNDLSLHKEMPTYRHNQHAHPNKIVSRKLKSSITR